MSAAAAAFLAAMILAACAAAADCTPAFGPVDLIDAAGSTRAVQHSNVCN